MSMATPSLTIGPLMGGGIVLGYRCPSRCRHCLYACGPHRRDGLLTHGERLDDLLDLLAERGPRAAYHIGGGEPFKDLDLLEQVIAGMSARGMALEYVETNAAWVKDARHASDVLRRMRGAGLGCALVSLSPFHAEFIPYERTLALIEAANQELPGGAFVWIQGFLADLRGHDPAQRLDLEALLAERGQDCAPLPHPGASEGGEDRRALALPGRYSLVPAGRAGRYMHQHGARLPWRRAAASADCGSRLAGTSHFHVDLAGAYVPGLCAGMALPLDEVPGEINLSRYPVLAALVRGGPEALLELADGFEPHDTYASACDLCTHVRHYLYPRGYAELGPPGFYDKRSVAY